MATDLSTARTLNERLLSLAESNPDHVVYHLLSPDLSEAATLTASELANRAKSLAGYLQTQIEPGDRVMLCLPFGLDMNVAYFGALLAGGIPTPGPVASKGNLRRPIFPRILTTSEPAILISDSDTYGQWDASFDRIAPDDLKRVNFSEIDGQTACPWTPVEASLDDPAVLLYSCHAGEPRGMLQTHRHLSAFARTVDDAFVPDGLDELRYFGFLYQYFDFGFQTQTALPLLAGKGCSTILDPDKMGASANWLKAIKQYDIGFLGCVVESLKLHLENPPSDLDLSSCHAVVLTNAYTGAPVQALADSLSAYGLKKDSLYPIYATAEATSLVTARKSGSFTEFSVDVQSLYEGRIVPAGNENSVPLVSQGLPAPDTTVEIVNPSSGKVLAEDEIGEIWVQGPGKLEGYWNDEDSSQFTFQATPEGADGEFVRTRDFGLKHDGELYVLEHWSNCLNYGSKQLTEAALEDAVYNADPRLEDAAVVSFFINMTEKNISIIVIEAPDALPEKDFPRLTKRINEGIKGEFGVPVSKIFFVKDGAIPRDENDDPDPYLCRRKFQPRCF